MWRAWIAEHVAGVAGVARVARPRFDDGHGRLMEPGPDLTDRRFATGSSRGATPGGEPIARLAVRIRVESIEDVARAARASSRAGRTV